MPHINTVNPRRAKELIVTAMKVQLPVMLLGQPGAGKSNICRQIAEQFNLEFIDIRLSNHDITDFMGLPNFKEYSSSGSKRSEFVPFDLFPLEDDVIPEGKKGWLVILDEITSCSRSMQVASYQLLLDRQVGGKNLHPNCFVVAAGNRLEDKAVVNQLSSALKSRMITLRVEIDPEQWIDDYAIPNQLDPRVIGYVKSNPLVLKDFDPESESDAYCCPRSLDLLSRLIKGTKITQSLIPLIAGTIGDHRAGEFFACCKLLDSCKITPEDVMADPFTTDMPRDDKGNNDTCISWMFITSLAQYVTDKRINALIAFEQNQKESKEAVELQNIIHYSRRFETPLRVIFLRLVIQANKKAMQCNWIRSDLIQLYGDIKQFLE